MTAIRLAPALRPSFAALGTALRMFGPRGWLVAVAAGIGYAIASGIPMVMIETPWFVRMTPTRPQDWVFWVAAAVLIGLFAGTYATGEVGGDTRPVMGGGFLAYLAIGCPICNKIAVLLLGVSGALTIFGPAQFFLGAASLALLGWALLVRARGVAAGSCPV